MHARPFRWSELGCLRKTGGVENFQQPGETARSAIVWCRRRKHLMVEIRRNGAQHFRQLAIVAERRRREIVRLIHHQQIPGQMRRAFNRPAGGEELLQHVGLFQIMIGGDNVRAAAPGIRVQAGST